MFRTKQSIDPRLVSLTRPASLEAEQYQTLRLNLRRLKSASDRRVIGITSPTSGDGKTLTAINLAGALAAESTARILLIEADLRRPTMAAQLGIRTNHTPGLAEIVLNAGVALTEAVRPLDFGFSVITAGTPAVPVHEVFNASRWVVVLQEARALYDYVILDTPPVLPVSDCRLLRPLIDGLLLVIAAHKTPRKLVEEALNLLDSSAVLGIVFNRDDHPMFGYHRRYYREYAATAG